MPMLVLPIKMLKDKNQYEKTINSIQNSINEYKMRINKLETVENCIKSRKIHLM